MQLEFGLFTLTLGQSYQISYEEYVTYTFDSSFALLGGYAAIIWQILSVVLSWY